MSQVDTMKSLHGWNDTTITHFNDLAVWGEQIVLSIRYGDWIGSTTRNKQELGALLEAGDSRLHSCLSHGDGSRPVADTVGTEKGSRAISNLPCIFAIGLRNSKEAGTG